MATIFKNSQKTKDYEKFETNNVCSFNLNVVFSRN